MADLSDMRLAGTGPARRRQRVGGALVVTVLVVGLVGAWVLAQGVTSVQQRYTAQLMDQYTEDVTSAVTSEVQRYTDTLTDLAAAVGAQPDVTAGSFATITSRITHHRLPGANEIMFVVGATNENAQDVEALWQARGDPTLRFAPAATNAEHLFVVFNRALDGRPPRVGQDLSPATDLTEAMRSARSTGRVTASRALVLSGAEQQPAFELTAAVYGGHGTAEAGRFRGWILMALRGGDLITETLRARAGDTIRITLVDTSVTGVSTIIASSSAQPFRAGDPLTHERIVTVGERPWRLGIQPAGSLLSGTDQQLSTLVLGIAALVGVPWPRCSASCPGRVTAP